MKILKLKFKNINSLVGENEIDFTTPFFTNDGLFAITGKTGSGKSSILDAITLALYGKTPRVDITGSENHVMTKGQKDCYSEVTFEVSGKKWIASWKQERARTGTLKQVERAVIDENHKIVADKLTIKRNQNNSEEKSVNEKIEEILGLSFSQFTKVILLAQGSFTAFLKADKNDKGELLEQITGTEIYGEISKQVFERFNQENAKLADIQTELGVIQLLSEQDIELLNSEIYLLSESKKNIEKEIDQIDKSNRWLTELETITNQIQQLHDQLPTQELNYNQTHTEYIQKEVEFENAKLTLNNHEEIFKKVRNLDTKLEEKSKLLLPLNESHTKLLNDKTEAESNHTRLQSILSSSNESLLEKKQWALNHANYEQLITTYPVIKLKNEQLQTKNREYASQKNELSLLENELSNLQKIVEKEGLTFAELNVNYETKYHELEHLKSSLIEFLSGKEISQLQEEKENVFRSIELLNQVKDRLSSISKISSEVEDFKQKIDLLNEQIPILNQQIELKKSKKKETDEKIALLQENIQLAKTIQSLEEHRSSLKANDPCPLCGSIEHPFTLNTPPVIGEREIELENVKDILKATTDTLQKLLSDLTHDTTTKQNHVTNQLKAISELNEKKDSLAILLSDLKEFNIEIPIESISLEKIQTLYDQKQNYFHEISQLIQEAVAKENQIANIRDQILPQLFITKSESERKKLEAESSLQTKLHLLEEKKNTFLRLEKDVDSEKNELNQEFQKYNVQDVDALKICLESWKNNKTHIETIQNNIINIENQLNQIRIQIDTSATALLQKEDEKNILNNELETLKQERLLLFGEKNVDSEELRIKNILEQAEKAKNELNTLKQDRYNLFSNTKAILISKQNELSEKKDLKLTHISKEELISSLNNNRNKLNEIIETIGGKNQLLSTNNANAERFSSILPRKQQQEKVVTSWKILNEQIGSKDGKKYRNFAQALTFEHLITLANIQLQKMSDRYALKRTGDANNPFELSVIDSYQNNDERTAQNLCGGENFMISLSLALGLASMAGKNMQIDSMFIDEGFATLDPDTLDVALNTLSNLQTEGKMIGVISHLTELKERIVNHIKVVQSGNGYSKIVIGD
jgi:exonuclease SbcC